MTMIYLMEAGENCLTVLPVALVFQIYLLFRAAGQGIRIPVPHLLGYYLFICYVTIVLSVTGIPSVQEIVQYGIRFQADSVNLIPFRWWNSAREGYYLNIALFAPLGFLLPFLWKRFARLGWTTLAGFLFSLSIELSQLFNLRATDIDDLLMNTVGAVLGYFLFWLLVKKHFPVLWKQAALQERKEFSFCLKYEGVLSIAVVFLAMVVVRRWI